MDNTPHEIMSPQATKAWADDITRRRRLRARIREYIEAKSDQPTCPNCADTGAVVGASGPEGLRDCPRCSAMSSGYYAVQNAAGHWSSHWYAERPVGMRAYVGPYRTEQEALTICQWRNGR